MAGESEKPEGRALDREVATMLAWSDFEEEWEQESPSMPDYIELYGLPPDDDLPDVVPRYSTDISAAWEVAEAMREKGWNVIVSVHESGAWMCNVSEPIEFDGDDLVRPLGGAVAETAPLAICLAALATREPETEVER